MNVEQLLQWRLARAEEEAPPAPRASRLLELARPWWQTAPDTFRRLARELAALPYGVAHAMDGNAAALPVPPVPVLLVRREQRVATQARVSYVMVRERQLRLRFELNAAVAADEPVLEALFIATTGEGVLFEATAHLSPTGEYRVEVSDLPEAADEWHRLNVANPMPFRLILCPPGLQP